MDRAHDVGLLNDADTVYGPVRILLDHLNAETALPECDRGRQSADSAANDQD
jgi:hypothetical protein